VTLSPRSRTLILLAALLATLLAVFFAPSADGPVQPSQEEAVSAPRSEKAAEAERRPAAARRLLPLKRTALEQEPGDLFQVDRPPPPLPDQMTSSAGSPAPVAPPLPYTYMGRMVEEGDFSVFLLRQGQEKPYIVRTGDVLDGQYRVEAIRPPIVEFTYIPLGQKQALHIGSVEPNQQPQPSVLKTTPNLLDLQERLKQMLNSGASK
jgi:hypothetical protein